MEPNSLIFWLVCGAFAVLTLAAIVVPLLRAPSEAADRGDTDIDIYRDQLAEVDKDLARGVLSPEDAERTRTEIARRLLVADKSARPEAGDASPTANRIMAGLVALLILGAGTWSYLSLGAPGAPDLPRIERIAAGDEMRNNRMGQLEAEAQITDRIVAPIQIEPSVIDMIEQLREIVPTRPDDLNGWMLLASNEAKLHEFDAAAAAQARVIALKGDAADDTDRFLQIAYLFVAADGNVSPDLQALINALAPEREDRASLWGSLAFDARGIGHFIAATRAQERLIATLGEDVSDEDYQDLLDYMVTGLNGYVSPEAETIAVRLLQNDEDNVAALYYAGLLYAQTDRPDRAFSFWRRVIELGEPDALHVILAQRQIEDVAYLAGVDYTPPAGMAAGTRGPSSEDMAAAADMTAEERAAMITNMVANLSDRLATEGGTPEEWAQLIRALGVQGDTDRAADIWGEAQQVFAQNDDAVALIRSAAQAAGVAQ